MEYFGPYLCQFRPLKPHLFTRYLIHSYYLVPSSSLVSQVFIRQIGNWWPIPQPRRLMVPENCEILTDSRSSVPMSGELDVFRLRNNFQTAKICTLFQSAQKAWIFSFVLPCQNQEHFPQVKSVTLLRPYSLALCIFACHNLLCCCL